MQIHIILGCKRRSIDLPQRYSKPRLCDAEKQPFYPQKLLVLKVELSDIVFTPGEIDLNDGVI